MFEVFKFYSHKHGEFRCSWVLCMFRFYLDENLQKFILRYISVYGVLDMSIPLGKPDGQLGRKGLSPTCSFNISSPLTVSVFAWTAFWSWFQFSKQNWATFFNFNNVSPVPYAPDCVAMKKTWCWNWKAVGKLSLATSMWEGLYDVCYEPLGLFLLLHIDSLGVGQ